MRKLISILVIVTLALTGCLHPKKLKPKSPELGGVAIEGKEDGEKLSKVSEVLRKAADRVKKSAATIKAKAPEVAPEAEKIEEDAEIVSEQSVVVATIGEAQIRRSEDLEVADEQLKDLSKYTASVEAELQQEKDSKRAGLQKALILTIVFSIVGIGLCVGLKQYDFLALPLTTLVGAIAIYSLLPYFMYIAIGIGVIFLLVVCYIIKKRLDEQHAIDVSVELVEKMKDHVPAPKKDALFGEGKHRGEAHAMNTKGSTAIILKAREKFIAAHNPTGT